MINVYTQYFQKSKVFLYPLLGVEQGIKIVPVNTYVCWKNLYSTSDRRLICVYEENDKSRFHEFEKNTLKSNLLYETSITLDDKRTAIIFNYSFYKSDYDCIIEGKYSKLSKNSKDIIEKFFINNSKMAERVNSFLYPEEHHQSLADKLGVDFNVIQNLHEICSKLNIKNETLIYKIPEELGLYNNNLISLKK